MARAGGIGGIAGARRRVDGCRAFLDRCLMGNCEVKGEGGCESPEVDISMPSLCFFGQMMLGSSRFIFLLTQTNFNSIIS